MAKLLYDGVIEAVRYKPNGMVHRVRGYFRRGPTFSDRILLDRKTLVERIRSGKHYVSGKRIPSLASTFEIGKSIRLEMHNGREVLLTGDLPIDQDCLTGIPLI